MIRQTIFLWLLFVVHLRGLESAEPCLFRESVDISEGIRDESNGNYQHNGVVYPPGKYGKFDYLEENFDRISVPTHIRGCICAVKGSCARFCVDGPITGDHQFEGYFMDIKEDRVSHEMDLKEMITPTYGHLNCPRWRTDSSDNFTLLSDGTLDLDGVIYDQEQYCISTSDNDTFAFICHEEESILKYEIYPVGMLFSVPFLIITFLVHGLIPELRNIHGKNLMSYVTCLAVAYTTMSIVHLKTQEISHTPICKWVGYVAYIGFVSSFFWLNVMCFDIWSTFRQGIVRRSPRKRFLFYCLYGWGCPLIIFVFAFVVDHTDLVPDSVRPNIGINTCFLDSSSKWTSFIYMYMLMILQLFFNITLFVNTAYQIRKIQKETSAMTGGQGESRKFNRMEADKDRYPLVRFSLYLRLFIVMGVTWLAELLSFALDLPDYYSYVTDIMNSLHGFFIFFLFVWKPKIRKLIVKRYRVVRGLTDVSSSAFRSSTGVTTASHAISRQQSTVNANMKNVSGQQQLLGE